MASTRLAIGRIRTSFGLEGLLRVESYSGEFEHFTRLGEVTLERGSRNRRYSVESIRIRGRELLIKLAGVDTPEAGRELAGWEILVDRAHAAPLAAGEYYLSDLCDCIVAKDSKPLGRIRAVCEGGNGDLLEIEVPTGGRYFVPFREEFVGDVDVQAGVVQLKADWLLS